MRLAGLLRNNVVSPHSLRLSEEKRRHFPVMSRLVLHALRRRTISKIVVTRKPGRARKVRLVRPQRIIALGILVGAPQARAILVADCPVPLKRTDPSHSPRRI